MPFTVVQDPQANADRFYTKDLEPAEVTEEQVRSVISTGGRVFETLDEAREYANNEAYPDGSDIPRAPGSFSSMKIGGQRVYVPKRWAHSNMTPPPSGAFC